MSKQDERAPRRDARQNRERILETARELIENEPDVSLNAIAKAAGVGPGTLYRHFANRETLVLTLYQHEIDSLTSLAPTLLRDHSPPDAMRLWMERLAKFGRVKHGVANVLHAAITADMHNASYTQMVEAIDSLLAAVNPSATLTAEDLLLLLGFLWRLPPGKSGEARGRRLVTFTLAALLPDGGD